LPHSGRCRRDILARWLPPVDHHASLALKIGSMVFALGSKADMANCGAHVCF
jgi:hypothetical protein